MTFASIHVSHLCKDSVRFSENLSLCILQVELQSALRCASAEKDMFMFVYYSTILIIGEEDYS